MRIVRASELDLARYGMTDRIEHTPERHLHSHTLRIESVNGSPVVEVQIRFAGEPYSTLYRRSLTKAGEEFSDGSPWERVEPGRFREWRGQDSPIYRWLAANAMGAMLVETTPNLRMLTFDGLRYCTQPWNDNYLCYSSTLDGARLAYCGYGDDAETPDSSRGMVTIRSIDVGFDPRDATMSINGEDWPDHLIVRYDSAGPDRRPRTVYGHKARDVAPALREAGYELVL